MQQGAVKAKAEDVLKIIDARAIDVTAKQRDQVSSCTDIASSTSGSTAPSPPRQPRTSSRAKGERNGDHAPRARIADPPSARHRGTAALACASALAVTIVSTAGHTGGSGAGAKLVAWTVTAGPVDSVTVMVRQTYNATGLQRTLRADGIPVRVVFSGDGIPEMNPALPPACHAAAMPDQANADAQARILGTLTSPMSAAA